MEKIKAKYEKYAKFLLYKLNYKRNLAYFFKFLILKIFLNDECW